MKCKKCGKDHVGKSHYKLVKNLPGEGYPSSQKKYPTAHEEASKAEKKKFGSKSYDKLKEMDLKAGHAHKSIGNNTKSGKIEVSTTVPKKLRKEVAYHEKVENKILRKKK